MAAIHRKIVTELWHPQPQHSFMDTKMFKAGLFFNGRQIVDGDIFIHLILTEAGKEYETQAAEMRKRSQTEKKSIFWIGIIDQASDHETVEFYRSEEILSRKERGAQTKTEAALVAEEKARLRRHHDELKRLLKQACLCGSLFFQGNDRSPDDSALDIVKTAAQTLAQSLPRVFYRFEEAAARTQKKDLDAVMTSDDLRGLPPIFTNLKLVHDQAGKPVFNIDTGPLTEVLARIKNRTDYGETASGRYITDEFAKEPFGWEFDMVRLFVVSLLRAGKIEATSKGQIIESATGIEAKNTFTNNNLFRQASFQLKAGAIEIEDLIAATEAFK